jgi:hypothetical protein
MDLINFGIEIETCSKLKNSKKEYDSYYDYIPDYIEKLNELIKTKTPLFINAVCVLKKIYDNNTWMIDEDTSVSCDTNEFYPIEIITPVFTYKKEDFDRFTNIFKIIKNENEFMYETNKTQGIHINISHPKQDHLKFLKIWWIYEPIMLRFIPFERQNCLEKFAKPLRKIFKDLKDIEDNYKSYYDSKLSKYSAVSIRDNRFEIRIINPSMDIKHILNWTTLCCRLLFVSIEYDTKEENIEKKDDFFINDNTVHTLFNDLFKYTGEDLKDFYKILYKEYNSL